MSIALVTPSYAPDYQRCRMLCESMDEFVSGYRRHVIIVDQRDYALFRSLQGPNREVVTKESILPPWLHKVPGLKKWWFSSRTLPVRGWILQQLVKLSTAEFLDEDVYLFADSDVAFIRPFAACSVVEQERVRLFSTPRKLEDYRDRRKQGWHHHAGSLLGVEDPGLLTRDYISQLVSWRRDTLRALTDHISERSGRDWKEHLCSTLDFSEYTLYGVFAEHILGYSSGHRFEEEELCYCSWHHQIATEQDLRNFLGRIPARFPAVLVQSNLGISVEQYQRQLTGVQAI